MLHRLHLQVYGKLFLQEHPDDVELLAEQYKQRLELG